MKTSLSVVIPFHNEEGNVERVVAEIGAALRASAISYELVCVDSGSTDRTGSIVSRLAAQDNLIRRVAVGRKGYGLAVLSGFAVAAKEWVTVVSGDGQTDPKDILKAYAVMEITGADFVKPRRFTRDDGLHRRVVSFLCSVTMKVVFRLPGWDFMGPPKIIKRSVLRKLALESHDRFIDTELLLKMKALGAKMEEVGVTYRKRAGGEGKVGIGTIGEYLVNIVKWRLHHGRLVEEKVRAHRLQSQPTADSSASAR
jgi:glycosyltransferase involved in cell wall biosynthesis